MSEQPDPQEIYRTWPKLDPTFNPDSEVGEDTPPPAPWPDTTGPPVPNLEELTPLNPSTDPYAPGQS